jgi:hypothetical protein
MPSITPASLGDGRDAIVDSYLVHSEVAVHDDHERPPGAW